MTQIVLAFRDGSVERFDSALAAAHERIVRNNEFHCIHPETTEWMRREFTLAFRELCEAARWDESLRAVLFPDE